MSSMGCVWIFFGIAQSYLVHQMKNYTSAYTHQPRDHSAHPKRNSNHMGPTTTLPSPNSNQSHLHQSMVHNTTPLPNINTPIPPAEKECINQLLEAHQDVFQGTGLLKGDQVKFHIDHSVLSVAAPYQPVPLAYGATFNRRIRLRMWTSKHTTLGSQM